MALDCQARIVRFHPVPVVFHPDLFLPAELDMNLQPARTRVDRVFDELFHDRGGAFHHFAGRDLVGQVGRETGDPAHPYIQRRRRNTTSIATITMTEIATSHQNCAFSPPGRCGNGTFIP